MTKTNYARTVTALASFFATLLFGALTAQVASACTILSSGSTIPANYGAPYSFYGSKPLLIKSGDCTESTAGVVVGDWNSDTYVYDESYYWSGSRWAKVNLSGSPKQGDWIAREGTGSIPLVADRTWYVAYTCQNVSGQWRCGCADASCTQKLWQVQGFVKQGDGGNTGSPGLFDELINDTTPIPPFEHPTPASSFSSLPKDTLLAISEYTPLNNLGVKPNKLNNQSDAVKNAKISGTRWKDDATLKSLGLEYPLYIKRRSGNTRKLALSYGHPDNIVGSLYEQIYYSPTDFDQRWPQKRWAFSANIRGVDPGASTFLKEMLDTNFKHDKGKNIKTKLLPYELDSLLPGQKVTIKKDTKLKSLGIKPEGSAGNDNMTIGDIGGEGYTIEINTDNLTEINGQIADTYGDFAEFVSGAFDLDKFDLSFDDMNLDRAYTDVTKAADDLYGKASVSATTFAGKAESWAKSWAKSARDEVGAFVSSVYADVKQTLAENEDFSQAIETVVDYNYSKAVSDYYNSYFSSGYQDGESGNERGGGYGQSAGDIGSDRGGVYGGGSEPAW